MNVNSNRTISPGHHIIHYQMLLDISNSRDHWCRGTTCSGWKYG